jgi:dynein heavy chain
VFAKLWLHESSRVFSDRLINNVDREKFVEWSFDLLKNRMRASVEKEDCSGVNSIIFSNLLKLETEDKNYEEIVDKAKLLTTLYNLLYDYNITYANKMDLVFF